MLAEISAMIYEISKGYELLMEIDRHVIKIYTKGNKKLIWERKTETIFDGMRSSPGTRKIIRKEIAKSMALTISS